MIVQHRVLSALATIALVLAAACSERERPAAAVVPAEPAAPTSVGPLRVVAMNAPLACFATRIGGDLVEVVLAPPRGADPAFWTPSIARIEEFQRADLILLNGAGQERWLDHVSLPAAKAVETAAGFRDRWIESEEGITHSHGASGMHTHRGFVSTTWLDPTLAIEQAEAVRDALARARPDFAETFDTNFASLRDALTAIDDQLERAIHGSRGLPILYSHPIYQYLERRFALNGRSLAWEPGAMPDDREWTKLAALLAEHPARWMLWEAEPGEEIRARLREAGIEAVLFRPAANLDADTADPALWIEIQRDNAAALAKVYE
jgi:zinc transport system substrate-binding protein